MRLVHCCRLQTRSVPPSATHAKSSGQSESFAHGFGPQRWPAWQAIDGEQAESSAHPGTQWRPPHTSPSQMPFAIDAHSASDMQVSGAGIPQAGSDSPGGTHDPSSGQSWPVRQPPFRNSASPPLPVPAPPDAPPPPPRPPAPPALVATDEALGAGVLDEHAARERAIDEDKPNVRSAARRAEVE